MKNIKETELRNFIGTNLQFQVEGFDSPLTMFGINGPMVLLVDENGNTCSELFEKVKPILYPFHMLVKEIEYKKDRFIPLGKLHYKFCLTASRKRTTKAKYDYFDDVGILATMYDTGKFGITINKSDPYRNELRILRHLFNWHIDVFGWIDDKLAIDKTLELCHQD